MMMMITFSLNCFSGNEDVVNDGDFMSHLMIASSRFGGGAVKILIGALFGVYNGAYKQKRSIFNCEFPHKRMNGRNSRAGTICGLANGRVFRECLVNRRLSPVRKEERRVLFTRGI